MPVHDVKEKDGKLVVGDELLSTLMASPGTPLVIDFYAPWCSVCTILTPKFEALAVVHTDIVFVKLDVDALEDELAAVTELAAVSSLPAFKAFKGGAQVAELLGGNQAKLVEMIRSLSAIKDESADHTAEAAGSPTREGTNLASDTEGVSVPEQQAAKAATTEFKTAMLAVFATLGGKVVAGSDKVVDSGPNKHFVSGNPFRGPVAEGLQTAIFGNGCFWGTELRFWTVPGVQATAVGYAAGFTENATYNQVCSHQTGHNEVVLVIYDPEACAYADLLKVFWESHDPTQGFGQGNDRGTNYRSGIYPYTATQEKMARASRTAYGRALTAAGVAGGRPHRNSSPQIKSEIFEFEKVPTFYYAEAYHQQYLAKPGARPYCSAQPTTVDLPPAKEWCPADLLATEGVSKVPASWFEANPSGCHLQKTTAFKNIFAKV